MRKTKKRVTAATKLQALARGKHVRSQQKRQNNALTKLQALARGKRDRRTVTEVWVQLGFRSDWAISQDHNNTVC